MFLFFEICRLDGFMDGWNQWFFYAYLECRMNPMKINENLQILGFFFCNDSSKTGLIILWLRNLLMFIFDCPN